MKQNPRIIPYGRSDFIIRFIRRSGKQLFWKQGFDGRYMKSELVTMPDVLFETKEEAEKEIKEIVIPYLLKEKDVAPEEIVGW